MAQQDRRDPRLTKNSRYWWKKRATAVEKAQYKSELSIAADMQRALDHAYSSIEKEIYALYGKYAENNQMTIAAARAYLNDAERDEFQHDLQDYINMARNNSDGKFDTLLDALSTRARISRLESLQVRSAMCIREAYGGMDSTLLDGLEKVMTDTQMRTAYEIQTAKAQYEPFQQIDKKSIDRVLAKPWTSDGKTFSKRLWTNQKDLINTVQDEMVKGFTSGVDPAAMTKSLAGQFGVAKYAAKRLAVTEGAYFASLATGDTYQEYDVDKYQILATLDDRTCDICASLDGEIHDMKDYRPGDTAPPFHPNCRTTTIPYIENNVLNGKDKRAARDPKTGKTVLVDGELIYPEWKKQFVDYQEKEEARVDDNGERNGFMVNFKLMNSAAYHERFSKLNAPKSVQEGLYRESLTILGHRNGTAYEDITMIDARTGKFLVTNTSASGDIKFKAGLTKEQTAYLENLGVEFEILHNHPGSTMPSRADISGLFRRKLAKASTIIGHDGTLYRMIKLKQVDSIDDLIDLIYNTVKKENSPEDKSYIEHESVQRIIKMVNCKLNLNRTNQETLPIA